MTQCTQVPIHNSVVCVFTAVLVRSRLNFYSVHKRGEDTLGNFGQTPSMFLCALAHIGEKSGVVRETHNNILESECHAANMGIGWIIQIPTIMTPIRAVQIIQEEFSKICGHYKT